MENTIEYVGRATALRLGGYDKETGRIFNKYYPQVEFIEADSFCHRLQK